MNFFRRAALLVRGVFVDRDRPDLERLGAITDGDEFVWAVLPHAARSFAASILALPRSKARAAAVAYLYCRILDTYEDLEPDVASRPTALLEFARRFETEPMVAAPAVPDDLATDDRDRVHLLLVARVGLVDAVYARLSPEDKEGIAILVGAMARGMSVASSQLAAQGGTLADEAQLDAYCHAVIGEPATFTVRLLFDEEAASRARRDAMEVGVMVQLANVTRDIEKDVRRGVGYEPALGPLVNARSIDGSGAAAVVRRVRARLIAKALRRVGSYERLVEEMPFKAFSQTRAAAVMLLLFTDRYYRSAVGRVGMEPWPGPGSTWAIYASAFAAAASSRWTTRVISRVEAAFTQAANDISEMLASEDPGENQRPPPSPE